MSTKTLGCVLFATLFTTSTFSQAATPADKAATPAVSPAPGSAPVGLASVNLDRLQMRDSGLSCHDLKAEVDVMDNVYKAPGSSEAGRGEMPNAATASAVGQVATGAAIRPGRSAHCLCSARWHASAPKS